MSHHLPQEVVRKQCVAFLASTARQFRFHANGVVMPQIALEQLSQVEGFELLQPVPVAQTQDGPTCGFYALSIVMQYWKARTTSVQLNAPPARKRDREFQSDEVARQLSPGDSLRKLGGDSAPTSARTLGQTGVVHPGGLFSIDQIRQVAKAVRGVDGAAQYTATIITERKPEDFKYVLLACLRKGIPPIVAFDVDNGDPVQAGGKHAHWGVLVGHHQDREKLWFAATHGHGKYYKWIADDLVASNFGLDGGSTEADTWKKTGGKFDETKFYGVHKDPSELRERMVKSFHRLERTRWDRPGGGQESGAHLRPQPPADLKAYLPDVQHDSRTVPPVKMDLAHHILAVSPREML